MFLIGGANHHASHLVNMAGGSVPVLAFGQKTAELFYGLLFAFSICRRYTAVSRVSALLLESKNERLYESMAKRIVIGAFLKLACKRLLIVLPVCTLVILPFRVAGC